MIKLSNLIAWKEFRLLYKFAKEDSSAFDLPKNVSKHELLMIEFRDITNFPGLLKSFTIGLGVDSFSICSSLSRNSPIVVSVNVEAIVVEVEIERYSLF